MKQKRPPKKKLPENKSQVGLKNLLTRNVNLTHTIALSKIREKSMNDVIPEERMFWEFKST